MSDLKIGELYLVKDWFWLLYPTKEVAECSRANGGERRGAYKAAKLYSEKYKCNVAVVEENIYVVLLEQDNYFFKVLDSNGNVGWIHYWDFSKHFELVKAKQ